jgi:hypothetical protein
VPDFLFDSNALIYSAVPSPVYGPLRELLVLPTPQAAVSAISLVEVLGFPRLTPLDQLLLEAAFEAVVVIPILDNIIAAAVDLSRRYGLKAADAIIGATALETMRTLVSADDHFRRVPGLLLLHPLNIRSA